MSSDAERSSVTLHKADTSRDEDDSPRISRSRHKLKKRDSDLSSVFKVKTTKCEISPNGQFARSSNVLGKGGFKKVYKAMDLRTGREVAWSSVSLVELTTYQSESLLREVKIQKKMKHRFLMPLLHRWIDRDKDKAVIITPLATPLREYVEDWRNYLQLTPVRRWTRQILTALAYLHTHEPQVIHRDLKLDNVLLSPEGHVWLGDYGLARYAKDAHRASKDGYTKMIGTPSFMAPELFNDEGGYDYKVDVYAFGMTLLELLTGKAPYSNIAKNLLKLLKAIEKGKMPQELDSVRSPQARNMIKWCLHKDPRLRPDTRELLLHPFLLQKTGVNPTFLSRMPLCFNRLEITCNCLMKRTNELGNEILEACRSSSERERAASEIATCRDRVLDLLQEAIVCAEQAASATILSDQVSKYAYTLYKKAGYVLTDVSKDLSQSIDDFAGERETLREKRRNLRESRANSSVNSAAQLDLTVDSTGTISENVDDKVLDLYKMQCSSLRDVMHKAVEDRLSDQCNEATEVAQKMAIHLASQLLEKTWKATCEKTLADLRDAIVKNHVDAAAAAAAAAAVAHDTKVVMARSAAHSASSIEVGLADRSGSGGGTMLFNDITRTRNETMIVNQSDIVDEDTAQNAMVEMPRDHHTDEKRDDKSSMMKATVATGKVKQRRSLKAGIKWADIAASGVVGRASTSDVVGAKSQSLPSETAAMTTTTTAKVQKDKGPEEKGSENKKSHGRPPLSKPMPSNSRSLNGEAGRVRTHMDDTTFARFAPSEKETAKGKGSRIRRSNTAPVHSKSGSWHEIRDELKGTIRRSDGSPPSPLSPERAPRKFAQSPSPMSKMLKDNVGSITSTSRSECDSAVATSSRSPAGSNLVKIVQAKPALKTVSFVDSRGRSSSGVVLKAPGMTSVREAVANTRRTRSDITANAVKIPSIVPAVVKSRPSAPSTADDAIAANLQDLFKKPGEKK